MKAVIGGPGSEAKRPTDKYCWYLRLQACAIATEIKDLSL